MNQCGLKKSALPLKRLANGSCVTWYPHNLVAVNNIFEVAKAAKYATAYADKRPAFEVGGTHLCREAVHRCTDGHDTHVMFTHQISFGSSRYSTLCISISDGLHPRVSVLAVRQRALRTRRP